MASVNKVILIGNLGQAPDVRITNSGIKVAEISIATSSYFNRDNERVEKTTWHTVTLWNKLAEIVEQYTGKGSSIYIEGRLETDKWQDQNGQNRYTTKIIAESVQLLDKRRRQVKEEIMEGNNRIFERVKASLTQNNKNLSPEER